MQKESLVLDSTWHFKEFPLGARRMRDLDSSDWLPAVVPSSIFTCLAQNGMLSQEQLETIPDNVSWVSEKSWVFRKEFDVSPTLLNKEHIEIIFEGLDTVAHVWLNEKLLGKPENMFIPHRFDIKPYLKRYGNILYVKLVSALEHTGRLLHRYGQLGDCHSRDPRSSYIRKAAYHFGSEYGPAPVGCGIPGAIRIEGCNTACIENLYLRTVDCNQYHADIRVALQVNRIHENNSPLKCRVTLTGSGLELTEEIVLEKTNNTASTLLHIDRPFLWWPRGYGVQHLYHIKTELLTIDGQLLDRASQDFGVRTIRVEKTPEKTEFLVNDHPVRIKGADWLPMSLFPGIETPDDYKQHLKHIKDCHINMLRVWAGGYYEAPAFYELCDRMGILVWQDFMFDSVYYPDRQWFVDSIRKEAESIIKRLRNYTCLSVWCGNNNIDFLHKSGALGKGRKFYGKPIFHELLPKLVHELDHDREYIPSRSHCDKEDQTRVANTPNTPSTPCLRTLQASKFFKNSFGILENLTYSPSATEKNAQRQMTEFLPPRNLSEYIWQSQVVQARCAKRAIERFRSIESVGWGCMLEPLNDFALSVSPSMLDIGKCPKALYYYARRFFAPVLVTLLPDEETGLIRAFVVNDTGSPVTGVLSCRMMNAAGDILDATEMPVRVSPFSKTGPINLPKSFTTPDDPSRCFLGVCIRNNNTVIAENTYFYCPDKQFKWPIADLDIEVTPEKNIWNITLSCETLVRDLQITPSQPATLSDNFLTLQPNKHKTIQVTFEEVAPLFKTPIKLFSTNQLF